MSQKRILFTVTNDLVYDQRMIRICSSLSENGYSVKLIGRKRLYSKALDKKKYNQKRINCFFDKGKLFYLEYNIRLFWLLLFSRFDAVCSIDLDTLLPVYAVCKIRGKICVYDAHEYFTEVPEIVNRPFVKSIWEAVGNLIVPKLKYCYTVCESLSEVFFEKYNTRFEVIKNVPYKSTDNINLKSDEITKIIFYQGALNAGRGLEQAIEAMQWISGAQLWLVGEGDLSVILRDLVKYKNLDHKIKFKGYLKPSELPEITAKATIGLNLLENTSLNYYYSLANKAFDYIQAEVPSIHMNFPEYRKLNQAFQIGLLVDELEPENLAFIINNLLKNNMLYDSIVQNCNAARKVFIWEVEELKLLDFYNNIFKEKSPS